MIELAVTILVAVLVLGATQIPALGDALGRFFRGPPDHRSSTPGRASTPPESPEASSGLRSGRSGK
jgi:hypothetical protein